MTEEERHRGDGPDAIDRCLKCDKPECVNCLSRKSSNKRGRGSEKRGRKGKPVLQYAIDGTFLREYQSRLEAAEAVHISSTSIIRCINGELPAAGGYIWRSSASGGGGTE